MGFSDELHCQELVNLLSYGCVLLDAEALPFLFDFLGRWVHAEVVFDDRVVDLRHLLVTPSKHVLVLDEK